MKEYSRIRVLLIEGRARQVLPMSKSLRELGCEITTYNGSKLDPGYASKYPHRKLLAFVIYVSLKNHIKQLKLNWKSIIMILLFR